MRNLKYEKSLVEEWRDELVCLGAGNPPLRFDEEVQKADDFYYVYETNSGKILYYSRAVMFIPLKLKLPEDEYNDLVIEWNKTHFNKAR